MVKEKAEILELAFAAAVAAADAAEEEESVVVVVVAAAAAPHLARRPYLLCPSWERDG